MKRIVSSSLSKRKILRKIFTVNTIKSESEIKSLKNDQIILVRDVQ